MMEGHHEFWKSLSLKSVSPLEEISRVSCQNFAKGFSVLEVKIGHGGQDEPPKKSGITSEERKGGVVSCGLFTIP